MAVAIAPPLQGVHGASVDLVCDDAFNAMPGEGMMLAFFKYAFDATFAALSHFVQPPRT